MIANADTKTVIFLSVALKDGAMEAFADVNDAIAHATALVEGDGMERAIFVAMPRAHVHRAVRVDPVDPPPMPTTEHQQQQMATGISERSQEIMPDPDSHAAVVDEHHESDEERDRRPIGTLETDLDTLGRKLRRAQADYDQARSRGDEERLNLFGLQKNAIAAELNRLTTYLSRRRLTTNSSTDGSAE